MGNEENDVRSTGNGAGKKGRTMQVRARRDGAKLTPPLPDSQGTDISGGWEDSDACTFLVNRAGKHIECWFTDYKTKYILALAGDETTPDVFELWDSPHYLSKRGMLRTADNNNINLTLDGIPYFLARVHSNPALSENVIAAFPPDQRQGIWDNQWRPLATFDRRRVVSELSDNRIGPFIDEYYDLPAGANASDRAQRAAVVVKLDRYIATVFDRLSVSDQPKARPWAQGQLQKGHHKRGADDRPLLLWLQDMVPIATILSADPAPAMRKHLGITPESQLHFYRFELMLGVASADAAAAILNTTGSLKVEPGLGGGFWAGTLTVREVAYFGKAEPFPFPDGPDGPTLAEFTMAIHMGQIGVGLGVSIGLLTTGQAVSGFHWKESNFVGFCKMADISGGEGPFTWGSTAMFFSGSDQNAFPELFADFGGRSTNFGFGYGISEFVGYVSRQSDPTNTQYSVKESNQYGASTTVEKAIHFPFALSELTPEARQLLRIFAAQELAVFRGRYGHLVIEAHADRVDDDAYNKLLTECRAQNVLQALKDILGENALPLHRSAVGLGETGAQAAGDADNTQNPLWRRSDINLNGHMVVRLRGE